ncbi:MAG TPA: hydroxysqualene dehydroxylase HpnE [Candidatus Baltobacteraceae bacterium]|nr:hydroxysqualene dehydroxylase HpnE [Candidatus Baltobacteraceae bacterium]
MRVAVVGAGLAGLAAGVELKELGHHVELFERSRLLGGRATSFEIDGIEVDNGQHVFLFCCKEFLKFAERVDFENELYIQKTFDALVLARDGKRGRLTASPLPPPLHLMPSFMSYAHLGFNGKLLIARAILEATIKKAGDPSAAVQSFQQWLQVIGQTPETYRAFWDPFFIPALNAPFDRVSVDDALFTLRTAFLSDATAARFGYAKVPLAHLAANAAEKLDAVHLQEGVTALDVTPTNVTLTLSKGDSQTFDAVVIATPPKTTAKLLGDASKFGVQNLDAYTAYPILDVHLWHDGGSIGFDFAAALESPLQWIFEKAPGYLSCSFSAAGDSMSMPTADLEALAWREVQAFIPALQNAKLIRSAVTRNPEATWLPNLGIRRTSQPTKHPMVSIAGSWTDTGWPDTMESAVRSGRLAAHALGKDSRGAYQAELEDAYRTMSVDRRQGNRGRARPNDRRGRIGGSPSP